MQNLLAGTPSAGPLCESGQYRRVTSSHRALISALCGAGSSNKPCVPARDIFAASGDQHVGSGSGRPRHGSGRVANRGSSGLGT
jgi:hypothetical protein